MMETTFGDEPLNRDRLEISDERLEELMGRIKPYYLKDGVLYSIKIPDPRKIAFTWSPELIEPVENYRELLVSETFHGCGYMAFFKPSIAEVLAQSDAIDPFANGFYIDMSQVTVTKDGEGHIARCHWIRVEK